MIGFVVKRLTELLVGLFVIFILFEITLRLFPGLIPPHLLIYFNPPLREHIAERLDLNTENKTQEIERDDDGPALRIFKPYTTSVNKFTEDIHAVDVTSDDQGFCNPETMPYERERIDLISVGDSFTWCTAVPAESSWTALLQKETGISAYSLGTSGTGPYDYLQLLKAFGVEKSPETVIMSIFEGNDLSDTLGYFEYKENGGRDTRDANTCPPASRVCKTYMSLLSAPVLGDSYAFNLLLVTVRTMRGSAIESNNAPEDGSNFQYRLAENRDVLFNRDNVSGGEAELAKDLVEGKVSFNVFDNALLEFKSLGEEHNFKPVIVYIPSAYIAYKDLIVFDNVSVGENVEEFSNLQRTYFKEEAEELGISFVDTTESLQERAPGFQEDNGLLYFQTNLHLTAEGHKVVADVIKEKVFSN